MFKSSFIFLSEFLMVNQNVIWVAEHFVVSDPRARPTENTSGE